MMLIVFFPVSILSLLVLELRAVCRGDMFDRRSIDADYRAAPAAAAAVIDAHTRTLHVCLSVCLLQMEL